MDIWRPKQSLGDYLHPLRYILLKKKIQNKQTFANGHINETTWLNLEVEVGKNTNFENTRIGPADFITVVINGQRIGQLEWRFHKLHPIRSVSIRSLNFRIVAIPIAPKQQPESNHQNSSSESQQQLVYIINSWYDENISFNTVSINLTFFLYVYIHMCVCVEI